ncbi:MAG: tRNA lysidine(34) synthetase TilS [Clostridiaceae bacterium]
MVNLFEEVEALILKYNMIEKDDKVIVGLSGGPDSVCLLHILYKLKEKYNLTLYAAHVNHCIRGKDADNDEEYVKELCKILGIKCFVLRKNVEQLAKEKGVSSEMAGRDLRYEFFENLKKELSASKIAIAHNANDRAETILMRIIRGTGLEGLEGIKAVRDNYIIRPLIEVKRGEIEEYCERESLKPRIDATNLETIYSRNKVRLELIPYIQNNFNKDIITSLIRFSENVKKDSEFIEKISNKKFHLYCDITNNKVIIKKDAFCEDESIVTRIIRKAIAALTGSGYNFERKHIYDIISLQKSSTGKKINLVSKVISYNNYGNIELYIENNNEKLSYFHYSIPINKDIYIKELGLKITTEVIIDKKVNFINNNSLIKYFSYDKISNSELLLRNRQNGDSFIPLGMKGKKKLKDFYIDIKMPKEERDHTPILTIGDKIAWIVGVRTSEEFKVDKNTKNILMIKIERGA